MLSQKNQWFATKGAFTEVITEKTFRPRVSLRGAHLSCSKARDNRQQGGTDVPSSTEGNVLHSKDVGEPVHSPNKMGSKV